VDKHTKKRGEIMVIDNFTVNGKQFEIRLSLVGDAYEIRAFDEDKPANGFSYRVSIENQHDLKVLAGMDMVKELSRIAKEDVKEQRYQKLLEALENK
jgi:hypothetical protein